MKIIFNFLQYLQSVAVDTLNSICYVLIVYGDSRKGANYNFKWPKRVKRRLWPKQTVPHQQIMKKWPKSKILKYGGIWSLIGSSDYVSRRWKFRPWLFWGLFGVFLPLSGNNYGYVVMLSAAHDILVSGPVRLIYYFSQLVILNVLSATY